MTADDPPPTRSDDAAEGWTIRVPASSANLGAGYDVLGMALSLYADVGIGTPFEGGRHVEPTHPAAVAFGQLGGHGPLWVRSPIPMGRGLGFSGAVRVGGAAAALVQRHGLGTLRDDDLLDTIFRLTADLEGHADNVAPSIFGGIVVCTDGAVQRVPLAFDPAIVVWIPDGATTSTNQSRAMLPASVPMADAVFNIGRVATFVAACGSGDQSAMRRATEDRLHQPVRLAAVPECADAIDAALASHAWAAWLSGSGPTVAVMCEHSRADELAAALPASGHTKRLSIDHEGVVLVHTSDVKQPV